MTRRRGRTPEPPPPAGTDGAPRPPLADADGRRAFSDARTFSGVCHGTLGELFQGPLRFAGRPEIALVSFPVDRHAWRHFTTDPTAAPGPLPPGERSALAAEIFLRHHHLTMPPGRWHAHSELAVGVGMASSTADVVATLRCLFRVFDLPYDRRLVLDTLSRVERADSVFLEEFALYLSGAHRVVRRLGSAVGFHTVYLVEPALVDTHAVTPRLTAHYRRHEAPYADCLRDMLEAFEAGDPAAVARASTTSATLSQQVLPKRDFETLLDHRAEFGADGIFVAHTGSVLGYLFTRRPSPALKGELSAFFHSLGHQCSFARTGYG
ncbi:hypothetical protein GL263_01970 [Streptomyces durbertensis]|uniref:GHMP kinase N-terminal domain-containing protein n=1 Tax=Streptomyces durbertensis TaxID=2448886 RepID=A0ABR6EAR7_9ACTN|nr:hypothetical protein [Streptomyces durbertensis]MBB1242348.1 hypothetical protein [Streptomyces durbertensis]